MRDIKFRVWNGKSMITENVAYLGDGDFAIERDSIIWDFDFANHGEPDFIGMQYTGLKDKNGVEIYDGDTLRATPIRKGDFEEWVGEVLFNEDRISYYCGTEPLGAYESCELEVIGNIHQNPELLES